MQIRVTTVTGTVIESNTDVGKIEMKETLSIVSATVGSSSLVNGDRATYTFTVTSPIPLVNSDIITIGFPREIGVPSFGSCTGIIPMTSTTSCTLTSLNKIRISMFFNGGTLAANTPFKFTVMGVRNPNNTIPSSPFIDFEITTSLSTGMRRLAGYNLTTGPRITTTSPSQIASS